jgi:hypothetical protein
METKQLPFTAGATYTRLHNGTVEFENEVTGRTVFPRQSFLRLENGSVMAMEGGALLDFRDLSNNFINNYYIMSGLEISRGGNDYTAQTTSGVVTFGENLWKLSQEKYLVQSPVLTVNFSETDVREAGEYVQVYITADGIAQLLTAENIWTTISPETYILTQGGVKIYPISQIIDDGVHDKMTVAKLTVSPDDAITLAPDELRRQIVPELNINTIDGQDGEAGDDGQAGQAGQAGEAGELGQSGEIGQPGELGQSGELGRPGDAGQYGVSGQIGSSGQVGQLGNAGSAGGAGSQGAIGAGGSDGSDGSPGLEGVQGESGSAGGKGATGPSATQNSSTNSGLPNMNLVDWNVTATEVWGSIYIDPETVDFLTAMWDDFMNKDGSPDAAQRVKYAAKITIKDEATGQISYCLQTMGSDVGDDPYAWFNPTSPTFAATVDAALAADDVNYANFIQTFAAGGDQNNNRVYFKLAPGTTNYGGPLKPDTRYTLTVNAYYYANSTVFSRDFISRTFYTDSSGLIMSSKDSKLINQSSASLEFTALLSDDYKGVMDLATVYLLSAAENAKFTDVNSAPDLSKVAGQWTIQYDSDGVTSVSGAGASTIPDESGTGSGFLADLSVLGLSPNTKYYARVVTHTRSGVTTLSSQQLELITLKRAPYEKDYIGGAGGFDPVPSAFYNRSTGAVEVSRPTIIDPDGAVTSYVYSVYKWIGPGPNDYEEQPALEHTISGNAKDPVNFYVGPAGLKTNTEYKFYVSVVYNDNQKVQSYPLGKSEAVKVLGDTMPGIRIVTDTFTEGVDAVRYDAYKGNIYITLGANSKLKLAPTEKLILSVYKDLVYDETIELKTVGGAERKPKADDPFPNPMLYNVVATGTPPDSEELVGVVNIFLQMDNLYKNTQYTINVKGYVDVGDGSGFMLRDLGTVSIATRTSNSLQATFVPLDNSLSAIGTNLLLSPLKKSIDEYPSSLNTDQKNAAAEAEAEYTNDVLTGTSNGNALYAGRVTLELYSGSGAAKQKIGETRFTGADAAAFFATGGKDITESSFGGVSLAGGASYTLVVSEVADITYNMSLPYVNTFTINNNAYVVQAQALPPDLIAQPEKGIVATPILNGELTKYGLNSLYKNTLPDDTVLGYKLEAKYDNTTRLGVNITYYAMEYKSYYYTIVNAGKDPLGGRLGTNPDGAKILAKMTQNFDSGSNNAPAVIILFGGKPNAPAPGATTAPDGIGTPEWVSGVPVYYAGNDIGDVSSLNSGMGRGYRYVFAYTMTWDSGGGAPMIYPYDLTSQYGRYMADYGAGKEHGKDLGRGVVYLLNSGMCEAPKVRPDFHSYVYETVSQSFPSTAGSTIEDVKPDGRLPTLSASSGILETSGKIRLHFTWRADPDDAIVRDTNTGNSDQTKLQWGMYDDENPGNQAAEGTLLAGAWNDLSDSSTLKWYEVAIPYGGLKMNQEKVMDVWLEINDYTVNYTDIMNALNQGGGYAADDNKLYVAHIPLEFAWGDMFLSTDSGTAGLNYTENSVVLRQTPPEETIASNYLMYTLQTESARPEAGGYLYSRAYLLKLEYEGYALSDTNFTTQIVDTKTIYVPLQLNIGDGQYIAKVSTGNLAEFVGADKQFRVKATILFDDGSQGWAKVQGTNVNFGLEHFYSQSVGFGLQALPWITGSGNSTARPSNGVMRTTTTNAPFLIRDTLKADFRNAQGAVLDTRTSFNYSYLSGTGGTNTYLYPSAYGAESSASSQVLPLNSANYIVPKGMSIYPMKFYNAIDSDGKYQSGQIATTTPSIQAPYNATGTGSNQVVEVTSVSVQLNRFRVEGFSDFIDKGEETTARASVYAYIYDDEASALALTNNASRLTKLEMDIFASGDNLGIPLTNAQYNNLVGTADDNNLVHGGAFGGLDINKQYYIVFTMKKTEGGQEIPLVDSSTAAVRAYPFLTSSLVQFDKDTGNRPRGVIYPLPGSYFDKSLNLQFAMTRNFQVKLRYDIYSADFPVQYDDSKLNIYPSPMLDLIGEITANMSLYTPLLSDEEMRASGILSASANGSASSTLTIKMTPQIARDKLKPGQTYYLLIRATDSPNNDTIKWDGTPLTGSPVASGYVLYKFTVTSSMTSAAFIYVSDATSVDHGTAHVSTLTYQVTISDPQYSMMGHLDHENKEFTEASLYAVRFTYMDGTTEKRLYTVYDDDVFDGNIPKSTFKLCDATLTSAGNPLSAIGGTGGDNGVERAHILPDTTYKMYVFAVYDMDHNGVADALESFDANKDGKADSVAVSPYLDPGGQPLWAANALLNWTQFFTTDPQLLGKSGLDEVQILGVTTDTTSSLYHNTSIGATDLFAGGKFNTLLNKFWNAATDVPNLGAAELSKENPVFATLRQGFQAGEKIVKAPPDSGLLINEAQAMALRATTTRVNYILRESFGLLDTGYPTTSINYQKIKAVRWQVNGLDASGKGVNLNGVVFAAEGVLGPFEKGTVSGGLDAFIFTIPAEISSGLYTIQVRLYTSAPGGVIDDGSIVATLNSNVA